MLNIQVCAGQGFVGTVSYTGYRCRGSAAADTDFLLASTLDKWDLSGALRTSLLKDAVDQVQTPCPDCAVILERDATRLPGSGVSPFVWIVVFWCLIGGVLGALLARSKNRKTWEGAVLGVLLGLLGVLLVALLPEGNDPPPPTPAVAPAPAPAPTPTPTPPLPRDAPPPSTAPPSVPPDDDENPLEFARARYATGEITREEFGEITAALGHPGWSPRV